MLNTVDTRACAMCEKVFRRKDIPEEVLEAMAVWRLKQKEQAKALKDKGKKKKKKKKEKEQRQLCADDDNDFA